MHHIASDSSILLSTTMHHIASITAFPASPSYATIHVRTWLVLLFLMPWCWKAWPHNILLCHTTLHRKATCYCQSSVYCMPSQVTIIPLLLCSMLLLLLLWLLCYWCCCAIAVSISAAATAIDTTAISTTPIPECNTPRAFTSGHNHCAPNALVETQYCISPHFAIAVSRNFQYIQMWTIEFAQACNSPWCIFAYHAPLTPQWCVLQLLLDPVVCYAEPASPILLWSFCYCCYYRQLYSYYCNPCGSRLLLVHIGCMLIMVRASAS